MRQTRFTLAGFTWAVVASTPSGRVDVTPAAAPPPTVIIPCPRSSKFCKGTSGAVSERARMHPPRGTGWAAFQSVTDPAPFG